MRIIQLILITLLAGCLTSEKNVYEIELHNGAGDRLGEAIFKEISEGVNIHLKVEGLSSGFHGIHVHEEPICEGPNFISAGNHLNPENNEHGLMHPEGSHLGDLPNIEVDDAGEVDVELILAKATLKDGRHSLFQNGGVSLIITEDADDGLTQPSGQSGERIACGVLKKE